MLTDAAHQMNGALFAKVNISTVAFGIGVNWRSADEPVCILTQWSVPKPAG